MEKLNLDILWEDQQQDIFCIKKVESHKNKKGSQLHARQQQYTPENG